MPEPTVPALPPLLDGDCPNYREHGMVCVRGKYHDGDCGAQPATTVTTPCRSAASHTWPVPATVVGVFDCSHLNGNPPEPDSAYCLRCAIFLHDFALFAPTDGTVLPDIVSFMLQHEVDPT